MSRWWAPLLANWLLVSPAIAQQAYGPETTEDVADESHDAPAEAEPCEAQEQEDGVIIVCRELPDSERYRSPLPRPVQSDRRVIPGLTDPPCWVQPREGGGVCIRVGWAPEPAIMVDLTIYPEKLTEEEAEHVSAVVGEETRERPRLTGERVPIDLSED